MNPSANFVAVSAAGSLSAAVRADGSVAAWGMFGSEGRAFVPEGLSDVVSVAAGGRHCIAVKSDGTIAVWGLDESGLLDVPPNLSGVRAVAAGFAHSLALKSDGTVVAWGDNSSGACTVPNGLANVVAISAGSYRSVAIRTDGTVTIWGKPLDGSEFLKDVQSVVGNSVLLRDGTVLTLGGPSSNQYGRTLVEAPAGLSGIRQVAGEDANRYGLLADGTVTAWGVLDDDFSQVPDGLGDVIAIAAGYSHVLALRDDGTMAAWGQDGSGQLDVPTTTNPKLRPFSATHDLQEPSERINQPLAPFVDIAAGGEHGLALRSDGTVVAWGNNSRGQLNVPPGLTDVRTIEAGEKHCIALLNDGTVVTWGGTIGGPVDQPPGLSDVVAVAAGGTNNLALKADGTVVMWRQGFGRASDLPNDWTDIHAIGLGPWEPVLLRSDGKILVQNRWVGLKAPPDLTDVIALAASASAGYALLDDGRLVEWGVDATDPMTAMAFRTGGSIPFPELVEITRVSAGWRHGLALGEDGRVHAWGDNRDRIATVPAGLSNVVAIAAAGTYNLALTGGGEIVGWGSNKNGQLEIPEAASARGDSSADRAILSLTFRTVKAVAGWRKFDFSLGGAVGERDGEWIMGESNGPDVEHHPDFLKVFGTTFYQHLAFGLMEQHFPSFKWFGDLSTSIDEPGAFPIVVKAKVSIREQDLVAFRRQLGRRTSGGRSPSADPD